MSRWRTRVIAAIGALALLGAGLLVPRPQGGEPLDPRSPGPGGTKGVLDTVRELGHDVSLTTIEDADTIVVFADELNDQRRDEVIAHVEAGARLLLTDPFSSLSDVRVAGQAVTDPIGATARAPGCGWPAISDVGEVSSGRWLDLRVDDEPGIDGVIDRCFPVGDGHGMIRYDLGAGEVVVLSAPGVLTNLRLGDADNALLAVALLTRSADTRVAVVPEPRPGEGETSLSDLVPDRVWWSLLLAVVLFLTIAWERGRRLGAPVDESMPVRVPGSELVHAIGAMLQRADAHEAAARTIRRSATEELATAVGLPPDAPVDLVARRVADGRGVDADGLLNLLTTPIEDGDALRAMQSGLARIRATVRETPTDPETATALTTTGDQL